MVFPLRRDFLLPSENFLMTSIRRSHTLTGHGESELDGSITDMLAQDNSDTESLSLLALDETPEDAAAIIINGPASDLGEDEADLLID